MWTVALLTGWRTRSLTTTGLDEPPSIVRSITAPASASAWRRSRAGTWKLSGSSPPP